MLDNVLLIIGIIIFLSFVLFLILYLPRYSIKKIQGITSKEKFELENDIRKTIIQLIGGLAFLGGLFFTWQELKVNRDQVEASKSAARETIVTQQFVEAVNLLNAGDLNVRLGGIYSLERIAKESEKDRKTVYRILSSYIRMKSRFHIYYRTLDDFQSIINVILIGRPSSDTLSMDLSDGDIKYADMRWSNLNNVSFVKADLSNSDLRNCQMVNCDFRYANLTHCRLTVENLLHAKSLYKTQLDENISKQISELNPKLLQQGDDSLIIVDIPFFFPRKRHLDPNENQKDTFVTK